MREMQSTLIAQHDLWHFVGGSMRRSKIRTWEDVAECAGITVRELHEIANHEPRLKAILQDYPEGIRSSGIPMHPEELATSRSTEEPEVCED